MQNVLRNSTKVEEKSFQPPQKYIISKEESEAPAVRKAPLTHPLKLQSVELPFKKYLLSFPTVLVGVLGYTVIFFIFRFIEPASIRDLFWPNSYLFLLLIFLASHFFFFSFIFLNPRRGLFIGLFFTLVLFLRIHHFFNLFTLLLSFLPFAVAEILLTLPRERWYFSQHHARLRQKAS
jgi:hypothetical protein